MDLDMNTNNNISLEISIHRLDYMVIEEAARKEGVSTREFICLSAFQNAKNIIGIRSFVSIKNIDNDASSNSE
jgi:uncharacterized protein (DUF1778 family)